MRAADLVRAICAPVIELSLLLPLLLFWVLIGFAVWAMTTLGPGAFAGGILILVLILPPLFRFQTQIVVSYAYGQVPAAFDAEYFNWIGKMWMLFPLLFGILTAIAGYYAAQAWGTAGTWLVVLAASAIFPAALAVLAITHSALQAFNPAALINVYMRSGTLFLIAPGWLVVSTLIGTALAPLPVWAGILLFLFMVFSIASLTGALLAPSRLADDVYIAEPLEADEKQIASDLQQYREGVLAHAYGFISRDNREGGFGHIIAEIEKDPDPAAAWAWYFDRMLRWESRLHGLLFGQHYVHDALQHGEEAIALKVTTRCRYEDPGFKPLAGDRAALLAAAERSGNGELVEVLRKG